MPQDEAKTTPSGLPEGSEENNLILMEDNPMNYSETPLQVQAESCPACNSRRILRGYFLEGALLMSDCLKVPWWSISSPGIAITGKAKVSLCVACGLVWTFTDLKDAKRCVEKCAPEPLKRRLLPADDTGPGPQ